LVIQCVQIRPIAQQMGTTKQLEHLHPDWNRSHA
jgi:hypothetical protein